MAVYNQIFQMLDIPMLIISELDGKQRCEDANDAFLRMTGYSLADLQSDSVQQKLQSYQIDLTQAAVKSEVSLNSKQNRKVPVRVDVQPIPSPDPSGPKRMFVQFEDLTSYKWMLQQYERNKVLLSGVVDRNQHIRLYRDGGAHMLFSPDHMLKDETVKHFIAEQDQMKFNAILEETLMAKQEQSFTLTTSKLSGAELELSITVSPTLDGYGNVKEFVFVIWDLKSVDEHISAAMKLKIWMARRDVTAGHLSASTGISIQTISKLRNGKIDKPQRLTAELIASELQINVHDIWPEIRK